MKKILLSLALALALGNLHAALDDADPNIGRNNPRGDTWKTSGGDNAIGAAIYSVGYYCNGAELEAGPGHFRYDALFQWRRLERVDLYGVVGLGWLDHRGAGLHDAEMGWGWGVGFGLKKWWTSTAVGPFGGLRAGLWRFAIDWKDPARGHSGKSQVTLLEPSMQLGWRFKAGSGILDAYASYGWETDLDTYGEAIGQLPFIRAGLNYGWR